MSTSAVISCAVCSAKPEEPLQHLMLCASCKSIYYCSVEHQKSHWKIHKKSCFPIREKWNEQIGRYLVTTRPIEDDEIFIQNARLISYPYSQATTDGEFWAVCLGCCELLDTKLEKWSVSCPKCFWPICEPECKGILHHSQNECNIFQQAGVKPNDVFRRMEAYDSSLSPNVIYEGIQVLRCLKLKETDPAKWSQLINLQSHMKERKQIASEERCSTFVIKFIRDYCQLESQYPADLIFHLHGIVTINTCACGLRKCDDLGPQLRNVYKASINAITSKLTHSCFPNTRQIVGPDGYTSVAAMKPIEAGQILTECYDMDQLLSEDIVTRRQYLQTNYYFWCKCERCRDPTELGAFSSGIRCQKKVKRKQCPGFLLPTDSLNILSVWKCNNTSCGSVKHYPTIATELLTEVRAAIKSAETLDQKLAVLNKYKNNYLHENHFLLVELRYGILHPFSTKFQLAMAGTDYRNSEAFKEMNAELLEIVSKCLEMLEKFQFGRSAAKALLLFSKVQTMENILANGSEDSDDFFTTEFKKAVDDAIAEFEDDGIEHENATAKNVRHHRSLLLRKDLLKNLNISKYKEAAKWLKF